MTSAAQVVGAVTELRDRSAAEAAGPARRAGRATPAPPTGSEPPRRIGTAAGHGPRRADRASGRRSGSNRTNVLLVIDQRQAARRARRGAGSERVGRGQRHPADDRPRCAGDRPGGGDRARADGADHGRVAGARAARDPRGRGEHAPLSARPTAVNLRWAVERLMARYHAIGALSPDGEAIAGRAARRGDGDRRRGDGRPRPAGRGGPRDPAATRPIGRSAVLTHCNTGPLACGQFGTALGVVQAAHAGGAAAPRLGGRDPAVPPGRPAHRVGAAAGRRRRTRCIPDMAAGPLMAAGEVDVILVGADRVAANGDTANKIGTYTLAVLAARHGDPVRRLRADLVGRPRRLPDGDGDPDRGPAGVEVTEIRGLRIAPEGTAVRNPAFDVTPGGADHRHRDRGGRAPAAVRAGAARGDGSPRRTARGRARRAAIRSSRRRSRPDGDRRARSRARPASLADDDDRPGADPGASSIATGSSPRTRSPTSRIARRRARGGGSRGPATRSCRSCSSTAARRRSPCSSTGRDDGIEAILRDVITPSIAYRRLPAGEHAGRRDAVPPRARAADGPDVGRSRDVPTGARPGRRAPRAERRGRAEPPVPARVRIVAAAPGRRRGRLPRHSGERPARRRGGHPRHRADARGSRSSATC